MKAFTSLCFTVRERHPAGSHEYSMYGAPLAYVSPFFPIPRVARNPAGWVGKDPSPCRPGVGKEWWMVVPVFLVPTPFAIPNGVRNPANWQRPFALQARCRKRVVDGSEGVCQPLLDGTGAAISG